eukprot:7379178-Prymnesium_polylepis.1
MDHRHGSCVTRHPIPPVEAAEQRVPNRLQPRHAASHDTTWATPTGHQAHETGRKPHITNGKCPIPDPIPAHPKDCALPLALRRKPRVG